MIRTRLRIIVAGSMADAPERGGATWALIQYVVGLRRLGHEVVFLDVAGASGDAEAPGESEAVGWFQDVTSRFGLGGKAARLRAGSRNCAGLSYMDVLRFSRTADLLLNLDGALDDPALLEGVPVRVRITLQGRSSNGSSARPRPETPSHHRHFVTGITQGPRETRPPTDPAPILQPVVLDEWPIDPLIRYHALTAVDRETWRALADREPESYVSLPERARARFLLAVAPESSETASLDALRRRGWAVVERSRVAGTPDSHRSFIQGSIAGFALARNGAADPHGTWCGYAGACYLAAGRPVLVEDTGFGESLPADEGILPFGNADEAVAAVEALYTHYRTHARAARGLAESLFDSDRVLPDLLDRVGTRPGEMSRPA